MKTIYYGIIFIIANFLALFIGQQFTGQWVKSSWYLDLSKAPWTPPGWIFGLAWTTIMLCFGFYMAYWFKLAVNKRRVLILYIAQWVLNVAWNPIFFEFKLVNLGLLVLIVLCALVWFWQVDNTKLLKAKQLLLLPYAIWLLIAVSLNAYIFVFN